MSLQTSQTRDYYICCYCLLFDKVDFLMKRLRRDDSDEKDH